LAQQKVVDRSAENPKVEGILGDIASSGKLPEGYRIERRSDGSVWLLMPMPNGMMDARRVDSRQDPDLIRKGVTLWYTKFLKEKA
jgi:hypothetical protein